MRPSGGRAGRQGWWSEIAVTRSGCFGGRKQGAWDQIVPLAAILQRAWKSRRKGRNTPADTQQPLRPEICPGYSCGSARLRASRPSSQLRTSRSPSTLRIFMSVWCPLRRTQQPPANHSTTLLGAAFTSQKFSTTNLSPLPLLNTPSLHLQ